MEEEHTLLVLASTYPRWSQDTEPAFVHELSRRLANVFRVVVLCPRSPGSKSREIMDGVEIVRFRYAPRPLETLVYGGGIATHLQRQRWKWLLVPGFLLSQWAYACILSRTRRVHIIHAHWLIPQGLIASCVFGDTPYMVTSHGADAFAFRKGVALDMKRLVAKGSAVATVVSVAIERAYREQKLKPKKLEVVPMGVDFTNLFTIDASIKRNANEILFVGRLVEKKGLRYLFQALPSVIAKRAAIKLTIAGFGPDKAMLEKLSQQLDIESHVQFLGAVTQESLVPLYRRAGLFVAPFIEAESGDQEGLPVALTEAIACGCPLLAGDIPAMADIFEVGDDRLVDPRSIDRFAERILQELTDVDNNARRTEVLRAKLVAKLDWQVIADRYSRLLMEMLVPGAEMRTN